MKHVWPLYLLWWLASSSSMHQSWLVFAFCCLQLVSFQSAHPARLAFVFVVAAGILTHRTSGVVGISVCCLQLASFHSAHQAWLAFAFVVTAGILTHLALAMAGLCLCCLQLASFQSAHQVWMAFVFVGVAGILTQHASAVVGLCICCRSRMVLVVWQMYDETLSWSTTFSLQRKKSKALCMLCTRC